MWELGIVPLRGRGFKALVLLIVVLIVGISAAHIIPRAVRWVDDAKRCACAENRAIINATVERWHFVRGGWPDRNLSDIGADPEYFPNGLPVCSVDGSSYELDPAKHCVQGHGH